MEKYKIADFSRDPAGWEHGNPFHGDTYIIDTIYEYMKGADLFVETGTAWGESAYFIADNFPNKKVYTCEVDDHRFSVSQEVLKDFKNVDMQKISSPEFFDYVDETESDFRDKKSVFWLDAHGEWEENGEQKYFWPLRDEVNSITLNLKNYAIFIDDFKNPYVPQASYDVCRSKICGPEEILDLLNNGKLYVPTYTDITSDYHDVIIGVGLITDMELIDTSAGWKEVLS